MHLKIGFIMIKKIAYLNTSLVCASFLFGATSVYAALNCQTVCQGDVCGVSERLAQECIKECGTAPINDCRKAARKAFQLSNQENVRAGRQAARQNQNQEPDMEGMGAMFGDDSGNNDNGNRGGNINLNTPNSGQNDPLNQDDQGQDSNDQMNDQGHDQGQTPSDPAQNPDLSNQSEAQLSGKTCQSPQAVNSSIAEAITILQKINSCGGAQQVNHGPAAPPPPPPAMRKGAPNHGGGAITNDMLNQGRQNLRSNNRIPMPPPPPPAMRKGAPNHGGGAITNDMLNQGRNNLRKTTPNQQNQKGDNNQRPKITPDMLNQGRNNLRKTIPNARPTFQVNTDAFSNQLQDQRQKLKPSPNRNGGSNNVPPPPPPPPAMRKGPAGQGGSLSGDRPQQAARSKAAQRAPNQQQGNRQVFHNSESKDPLGNLGKMVADNVMGNMGGVKGAGNAGGNGGN